MFTGLRRMVKWLQELSPAVCLATVVDTVTTDLAFYTQSFNLLLLEFFRQMCSNTMQNRMGHCLHRGLPYKEEPQPGCSHSCPVLKANCFAAARTVIKKP